MLDKDTNKKAKKISDGDILKALRKAVLDSTGDAGASKKTIEKIASADDLSNELRTIGRKLVRKQKTGKSDALVLTTKDIEKIKAVSNEKDKEQRHSEQKVVKKEKKKLLIVEKKSREQKPKRSPSLKGVESVQKLLPKPTFFDRASIFFTKTKLLVIFLVALVVLGAGIPLLLYKSNSKSEFLISAAIKFNAPVAKVNGEKIGYKQFLEDVEALKNFFADEANATSFDISNSGEAPNEAQIRTLVLERHTRVLLIRQALQGFGESVTAEEVQSQLEEIIRETGGREELEKIVNDLYTWTVADFVEKALTPLLEEERLAIYVSLDDLLNEGKKAEIETILEQLKAGASFEETARNSSEDITREQGGDLDWFQDGTMVPAFEEQVVELEIGETSEPFKTNFGWHIVKLTDKETTDDGITRYRASHILIDYITLNEYVTELREAADIKILIAL